MWTGNQVNPMVQMLFPNNDAIFEDYNLLTHTETEVFSLGLRSMKMQFNIFPSQSNGQT